MLDLRVKDIRALLDNQWFSAAIIMAGVEATMAMEVETDTHVMGPGQTQKLLLRPGELEEAAR